jgi:hypothetical protein
MLKLIAFVVDQTSFALCPLMVVLGFRESVTVGAVVDGGPVMTVTVTVVAAAPPLPMARKV